jgi:O-antigen/teichoic acid export membrane protein
VRGVARQLSKGGSIERGIWAPFRSLLGAQVIGAVLGLVFWILAARLVDAHEVGVAAAAISAQTLLGIMTVLGIGTVLISDLPLHDPRRQRQLVLRGLLVVGLFSAVVGGALVALSPLFTENLREALGDPFGATAFVIGVVAAAWAIVVDEAALGVKRSAVQVHRNLLASSLRFPITAVLLALGLTDAHVLQFCWVLPLAVSVPFALWRLRLPRRTRGTAPGPTLRADVVTYRGHALRNHALSLSLASASQMVPVIAGVTLASVANAEFAIAWLMATFVFLPPYLLAIALFAHGANVSTEEFRKSMEKTLPASLLLSALLCVGAWVLGEPVLLIFGGDYASESWKILALLVPAGLWMCFKDHLVALWRSQRRFGLATKLAGAALLIEITGATIGAIVGGAVGLCVGWLVAMAVEAVLSVPWLREAFGGLHWQSPLSLRRRAETGRVAPHVVGAVVLVVLVIGVGVWTSTRAGQEDPGPGSPSAQPGDQTSSAAPDPEDCVDTGRAPAIDLGVQAATGIDSRPLLTDEEVGALVTLAKDAGADVISTTGSFRALQPKEGLTYRFEGMDRVISAARDAGLEVRLRLMTMPQWALDEPNGTLRQPPRTDAELARWASFVRDVMRHVDGQVAYVEVWNEPNAQKYWTTGPDPVEFTRLLATSYDVIKEVSPETEVISGGLNGNDIGFLEKMYDAVDTIELDGTPFDQLGVHPFAGSAAPDEIDPAEIYERDPFGLFDANFTGFESLHDVLVENGDDGVPVYLTQFGYSTKGSRSTDPVPDATRAGYLGTAFELATCTGYVSGLAWYAFHPTPWDPPAWTLLDARNKPNQTYAALQEWAERASG